MKIVLTGGGTGGSVTPLLAVAREIKDRQPDVEFLFIGSKNGPEELLARKESIAFQSIVTGKYRRYFSWSNLIDPLRVMIGFFQTLASLNIFKPDAVFGAGAYVSVPVIWAAKFLGFPSLIHQQDVIKSLANSLLQGAATRITVTFEHSLNDFPRHKTIWVGNPTRPEILEGDRARGQKIFNLDPGLPTVLVFGGGTGAQKINEFMAGAVFKLAKYCQIIHLTGPNKALFKINNERYRAYEFLADEMKDAYAAADIIVCRAGLASLTEIAALGKPAIIIPIPDTHQVANAALFHRANAAVVVDQQVIDPDFLVNIIVGLISNKTWRETISKNIKGLVWLDARRRLADEVLSLTGKKHGAK